MGCKLVSEPEGLIPHNGGKVESLAPFSFTKAFEQFLPTYLVFGMSADEFYHSDVCLAVAYRKAYKMRKDTERKAINFQTWLQGAYVYKAVSAVYPLFNPFVKDHKPLDYPDRPKPLTAEEIEEENERLMKERFERMKQDMIAWASSVNKKGVQANE